MFKFFDNETLIKYYKEIDFIFKKINSARKHLDVIFVFGSAENTSSREAFLKFINENNDTPFNFITIEKLYNDILEFSKNHQGVSAKKIELANLESEAIHNAYTILLFPESPGSFAELGFFSAIKKTRDKILILNNFKFYNKETYVNELIKLVHEEKQHEPLLYIEGDKEKTFIDCIERLTYGFKDVEKYKESVKIPIQEIDRGMLKLSFMYEIIKYLPYLTTSELTILLRYIYKEKGIDTKNIDKYISSMISLLVVSNLIQREKINEKFFFRVTDENYNLFDYSEFTENEHKITFKVSMSIKKERGII